MFAEWHRNCHPRDGRWLEDSCGTLWVLSVSLLMGPQQFMWFLLHSTQLFVSRFALLMHIPFVTGPQLEGAYGQWNGKIETNGKWLFSLKAPANMNKQRGWRIIMSKTKDFLFPRTKLFWDFLRSKHLSSPPGLSYLCNFLIGVPFSPWTQEEECIYLTLALLNGLGNYEYHTDDT